MKGKWTISRGVPDAVHEELRSDVFARRFVIQVIEDEFGVKGARFRPAEYYVQVSDEMSQVEPDLWGAIFTISGITRNDGRNPDVFHNALRRTYEICTKALQAALDEGQAVHLFVNMMLTGDVPLPPEIGGYSNVHEIEAVWVTRESVSTEPPEALRALIQCRTEEDDGSEKAAGRPPKLADSPREPGDRRFFHTPQG